MNLIVEIIKMLNDDEHYGVCPEIERAKGKFKIKRSFADFLYQKKRDLLYFLNKNK